MSFHVTDKSGELAALCRRFGVARLELFGSTARGTHTPASDLDFLVEFNERSDGHYADAYFGLLEALEALFGKQVDLVETQAVRNPYFLQHIEPTRTTLFAA